MLRSAIDGVHAGGLVQRALDDPEIVTALQGASHVDVLAAGKAAAVMLNAFAAASSVPVRRMLGVGPAFAGGLRRGEAGRPDLLPVGSEWHAGGHPLPDDGSLAGARAALAMARRSRPGELLVVLLSGGGSALMALPADPITLAEKQQAARILMEAGADIYELNTVRKHLSAIKGGQLAAAAESDVLTLAVSDVVGDDLSVIASGPTVADDSTYAQALAVLERRAGLASYPVSIVERIRMGVRGELPETPAAGDPRLCRASARVIGPQRGAIESARRAAETRGYTVHVIDEPVTGEARVAAAAHVRRVADAVTTMPRPACIISSGETTVTVTGRGKGGRNQEFAFAMAGVIDQLGSAVAGASIGTDGVDGPTDAAGAIVDPSTFARAAAAGIASPEAYLTDNNTYMFFDRLGDLIRTGPTSTNVGDLQVLLVADVYAAR